MATLTGNNGAVSINGIAVLAVRSFSIEMTRDTIETSTMGTDVRTYISGLSSFSGSAEVYFDPDTATTGFDAAESTFNPTAGLVGASGVTGKFYVELDATGNNADQAFTGTIIVTGYTVNATMDGMVEASISFQGSGAVAYSTANTVYP
jgi:glutamate dehydrogenase/leucine dehydrogenase